MSDLDAGGEAVVASRGKRIESVEHITLGDGALKLFFDDGTALRIEDAGRDCCESRYMTLDDDLASYAGATLVDVTVKVSSEVESEPGEVHEISFLEVMTSKGPLTVATHNEHNGYYGGFNIEATLTENETHG